MIILGDILLFKRNPKDKVATVLAWLLKRFDRAYDGQYWHTAFVSRISSGVVFVFEAQRQGAIENLHSPDYINEQCKVYHWFDRPPKQKDVDKFIQKHLGQKYDLGAYVSTLISHLWGRLTGKYWRVWDTEHTCWELTCLFCRESGKPLDELEKYPLISSMLQVLEGKKKDMTGG